jgi:hypothetical protein
MGEEKWEEGGRRTGEAYLRGNDLIDDGDSSEKLPLLPLCCMTDVAESPRTSPPFFPLLFPHLLQFPSMEGEMLTWSSRGCDSTSSPYG